MTIVVLNKEGKPADPSAIKKAIWCYIKALIEAEHPGVKVTLRREENATRRTAKVG